MGWARTAGIAFAMVLAATMSVPVVLAQSFLVTTSKQVYYEGERILVAGTVSEAGDRRPVLVRITSDGDECARHIVRPLRDGSFVSRPMNITGSGSGEFKVTATHAGATVFTLVTIENRHNVSDSFELRAMKATVVEAQDVVNARVRDILDANLAIPERAADAYGKGAAEASLTLQAIERGDAESADGHRAAALAYFREAFDLLSPETLNGVSEDIREEEARVSAASERFGRLQDMFRRLVDLADRNGVDAEQEFGKINEILVDARQFLNENKVDNAEDSLQAADNLLEEARKKLIRQSESDSSHALASAAERLERSANELRQDAEGVPRAPAMVNASFVLINGAKASIEDGDYDSAKASLDSALKKLKEAKKILESR